MFFSFFFFFFWFNLEKKKFNCKRKISTFVDFVENSFFLIFASRIFESSERKISTANNIPTGVSSSICLALMSHERTIDFSDISTYMTMSVLSNRPIFASLSQHEKKFSCVWRWLIFFFFFYYWVRYRFLN